MWPAEVVKGLEEGDSSSLMVPVFAEAQGFARKRSQCLTHSEIKTFNQAGTDGKTQFFEPLSTTENALTQGLESAMLLLFDNLCVDPVPVGAPQQGSWDDLSCPFLRRL